MKRDLVFRSVVGVTLVAAIIAGCGGGGGGTAAGERHDITAAQLETIMADGQPLVILDVRTLEEYAAGHVPGAINVPLAELDTWVNELCPVCRTVCVCGSGNRSQQAADQLVARGFTDIYNLLGGMNGWTGAVE